MHEQAPQTQPPYVHIEGVSPAMEASLNRAAPEILRRDVVDAVADSSAAIESGIEVDEQMAREFLGMLEAAAKDPNASPTLRAAVGVWAGRLVGQTGASTEKDT